MFLTNQNFDDLPYNLPNLTSNSSFQDFVDRQEEFILRMVLGNQLYEQFVAGLEALPGDWDNIMAYAIGNQVVYGVDVWESLTDPNTGNTPEEGVDWTIVDEGNKWLTLKKGANYTYQDKTYRYSGLVALLVPYIYSEWTRIKDDRNSGIGIVKAKAENADVISAGTRIADSWNTFSRLIGVMNGGCYVYSPYDTLTGFLWSNLTLYEDWRYKSPGRKNTFNL